MSCQNQLDISEITETPAYQNLLDLKSLVQKIIEEVVTFQHGGLNNSVDAMTEVVRAYTAGRDDIGVLRKSLEETQDVLMAKKTGQISLKELWLKKAEAEESLRILKDVEFIRVGGTFDSCVSLTWINCVVLVLAGCSSEDSAIRHSAKIPFRGAHAQQGGDHHVLRGDSLPLPHLLRVGCCVLCIQLCCLLYLLLRGVTASVWLFVVCRVQDLVSVNGVSAVREELLDLKEVILEKIVYELKETVHGLSFSLYLSLVNNN